MEIKDWLESLELGQYAGIFEENDITIGDLADLSADELKEDLGISSLGHRKKIMKAIAEIPCFTEEQQAVIDNYPYIIAYPYRLMLEEKSNFRKLQLLKDVFLNILKYTGLLVATEYFSSSIKSREINDLFRDKLFQPHFGHWNHFIREALSLLGGEEHEFLISELPLFYDRIQLSKKAKKFTLETRYTDEGGEIVSVRKKLTAIDGLINFRNRYIGHGTTMSESESGTIFETYLPLLEYILENMEFCTDYPLFRYAEGRIEKLMGAAAVADTGEQKPREHSIWLETPSDEELPLLPFFVPPEQYMAGDGADSRLFIYEQHTSRRIIYFSPEQQTGETAGEPVKMLNRLLESKSRIDELAAGQLTAEGAAEAFRCASRAALKSLRDEKKVIDGTYQHRQDAEAGIKAFFESDSAAYFLAAEAGSGKTNLLAEILRRSEEEEKPVLFLRAIRVTEETLEDSLREIFNLREGEDPAGAPALNSGAGLRILVDGLNEHRSPQKWLDSVAPFLGRAAKGAVRLIISWRISSPAELPEISAELEKHLYAAGAAEQAENSPALSRFAAVLSPLARDEVAGVWDAYSRHGSKEWNPGFSLEDLEAEDRIFAQSLSNPLLLRLFLRLNNRKKLKKGAPPEIWSGWYDDIRKRIPGATEFMKAVTGLMFEKKSLVLEFDSLFDCPETSETVRSLDIASPYNKLLSEGVLSLFFRGGILYLSFTMEASFHYLLSRLLTEGPSAASGKELARLLEINTDFTPVNEAASILLKSEAAAGQTGLLTDFTGTDGAPAEIAAAAAAVLLEREGAERTVDLLVAAGAEGGVRCLLAADLILETKLKAELSFETFGILTSRKETGDLPPALRRSLIYRFAVICHNAGKYRRALDLAEEYFSLCSSTGAAELELGYAEMRLADSSRKLMRSVSEEEAAELGEKALGHGRRAMEIMSRLLPEDHTAFERLYDMMMKIHEYRLEWDPAVDFGRKRINFLEANLGPGSPLLASAYNNTAIVLRENGLKDESIAFSRTAMEKVEKNLDPNHIEMAYANWTLANTWDKFGSPAEAAACMKKTFGILTQLLPENHPNIVMAKDRLREFETAAGAGS